MTLLHGDCLSFLKEIPTKSVNLVLTDPPYAIKAAKGTHGFGESKNRIYKGEWDNERPSKFYFDELLRIGQKVIIFGGNYFADLLPPSKSWIVWDKKGDIAFQNPFADCELIYTNASKPIKKITFRQQGFITDSKDQRFHPTQKPTELLEQIIKEYTQEGATVLDAFMGSGSTGVACVHTNRDFIGIEKDDHYFEIAQNRILSASGEIVPAMTQIEQNNNQMEFLF